MTKSRYSWVDVRSRRRRRLRVLAAMLVAALASTFAVALTH